jgi:hypothetical protein
MAPTSGHARHGAWILFALSIVLLSGCFERHEPANPFIGPYGDAEEAPFSLLVPQHPAADGLVASRAGAAGRPVAAP